MSNTGAMKHSPPDWEQRLQALNTQESFLVRASAGSGKTHLLTTRFLRLLAEVDDPHEVVAITFTRAAAAEMRQRIVLELEKAQAAMSTAADATLDDPLREAASKAVERIRLQRWTVMESPDQLRIQTIDSFCHSIAMRAPLQWGILSALGGRMEPAKDPQTLYRKAARRTLAMLEKGPNALQTALRTLLKLRDAQWLSMENLLCDMLADRGRWFKDFVFDSSLDGTTLRARLEAPMRHSALATLRALHAAFLSIPGLETELFDLLWFAAECGVEELQFVASHSSLPSPDEDDISGDSLRLQVEFYRVIAGFLLTGEYQWRKPKGLNKNQGFPATDEGRAAKERFGSLVARAQQSYELQPLLQQVCTAAVAGYSEPEWQVVLDAFVVLRYAAAQLQLVFAESSSVDFTEVAAIALQLLHPKDGLPSEFAVEFAAGIRHLLLDEFQDTSRKQYELIDSIIAAWPGGDGRTCFCVGDPMQSIYGFRESDYELFDRPAQRGFGADLEGFADSNRVVLQPIQLTANFRSTPALVADWNHRMPQLFTTSASSLASQTPFVAAQAVRELPKDSAGSHPVTLYLELRDDTSEGEQTGAKLVREPAWMPLVRQHEQLAMAARQRRESDASDEKYRIAILGRNRKTLIAAAEALRAAGIPYRADEIFPFDRQMEILDAISLAQAALNRQDRLAWASVLRSPCCGLALHEVHALVSADDADLKDRAIPDLVQERLALLADSLGQPRCEALLRCTENILEAGRLRQLVDGEKLGSWLHRLWQSVGGESVTSPLQQRNLQLLWRALDELPRSDVDLMECDSQTGWRAALRQLQPLPDPSLENDYGVRLMTIHKSKGLEFEVVILPELERRRRNDSTELLTWLERGIAGANPEDLTEFLIAPMAAKGAGSGDALAWVKQVKQARDAAEERRVFYVAATRAREELHLFATLDPTALAAANAETFTAGQALFQTIRPAFAEEIRRFAESLNSASDQAADETSDARSSTRDAVPPEPQTPRQRRILRFSAPVNPPRASFVSAVHSLAAGVQTPLYERPSGGLRTRAEGIAVHLLMQQFARLRQTQDAASAQQQLPALTLPLAAQLGRYGVDATEARSLARWAVQVVAGCALDPAGAWILSPHDQDFAEVSWTGKLFNPSGRAVWHTVRPDRCFLAGEHPDSPSSDRVWWIVDYKTTGREIVASLHREPGNPAYDEEIIRDFLLRHREQYAPQLNSYAQMLRKLQVQADFPAPVLRLGIYYPLLCRLDHWLFTDADSTGD